MVREGRGRGGAKKAPRGYYTAKQARERLGLSESTFGYYVRVGKIKRYIPPLRKEGYYARTEIDRLATEMALFLYASTDVQAATETRVAAISDVPGIVDVLTSLGWQTISAEARLNRYQVNPLMDYVVLSGGRVVGYVNATPYTDDALADMMSGKKRSWDITLDDILPYERGQTYDVFVGIATRQDVAGHVFFAFRLISGFLSFLGELANMGIHIRRMYATSAEPDGQKLCRDLGFVEQPAEPGDLFPRFMLDLETSESRFAADYRATISSVRH